MKSNAVIRSKMINAVLIADQSGDTVEAMPYNVRLQARAACGASLCEPLFGGTRA